MNREIKFRAFDVENKEMLEVDLLDFSVMAGYKNTPAVRVDMYSDYFDREEMILMQYTGLKDKNGVEIYEGDIVVSILRLDNGIFLRRNTDAVEWNEETSSFMLGKKKRHFHNNLELEVIGNIYENPDLLKESEE